MNFKNEFKINHDDQGLSTSQINSMKNELSSFQSDLDNVVSEIENIFNSLYKTSQTVKKPISIKKPTVHAQRPTAVTKATKTNVKSVNNITKPMAQQGKISYKVRGKDGKLMNIADITKWVNSIYDGQSGLVIND